MRPVIRQELTEHAATISLGGELDLATAQELRTVLHEAIAERTNIVVDMTDLRLMDSTSIGVLVRAHQKVKKLGGVVAFSAVPGNVARVLDTARLEQVFPVYPTLDAALEALRDRPAPAGPDPATTQ